MTTFDRIERRLPELMEELAPASLPDYFDDMLQAAARSRQRPAWSAPERWLPMGVIARPLPIRPIPWRMIAIVAAIGLLAATALLYVGSQRRVPAPFGLAANGTLAIATSDGDIVTVNPDTGVATPLISGPTKDGGPYFSFDGLHMVFDRGPTLETSSLFFANADGTGIRELLHADSSIIQFDWAPAADRAFVVSNATGKGVISLLNLIDGTRSPIPLDLDVAQAAWRPNHEQLIVTTLDGDDPTFWVANTDGSGSPRRIAAAASAVNEATVSPDGKLLAYSTWGPARIHVVDIDTGGDHPITTGDEDGDVWQSPQFMPDGAHILANRFVARSDPSIGRLAIIPVDPTAAPTTIGPTTRNPMPNVTFSPDGTKIVATYPVFDTTWMFDADGTNGHEVPFLATNGSTWQRKAR
jgi:dipeptidyl aminopeptidase/acylaminoacyl peptidase